MKWRRNPEGHVMRPRPLMCWTACRTLSPLGVVAALGWLSESQSRSELFGIQDL